MRETVAAAPTLVIAEPRSGGAHRTLQSRLLLVVLGPALVLLVTALVVFAAVQATIMTSATVYRARTAIITIGVTRAALIDQETGLRGYVLSGDDAFLEPYRAGADRFGRALAETRAAVRDAPAQMARLDEIDALHARWQAEIAEPAIGDARAGEAAAAVTIAAGRGGKAIVDDLRVVVDAFVADQEARAAAGVADHDRTSFVTQLASLIGTLFAGAVVASIGVRTVRRIVRDIDDVATAAAGLAAGDLDVRAPVRSDDEVGRMGAAFNAMADRLQAAAAAERDVSVRLREQATALEAANAELESFSYSVSHDLRAPLRTIDGFSAILVEDHGTQLDDEALRVLGRVRLAAQRMGELIDDLLQLSRVSRVPLSRGPVHISALAIDVVAALRRADPDRVVAVDIAAGMTTSADPGLARVVLENLLSNAWKFTVGVDTPTIRLDSVGPGVFRVRDNGAGFDMAYSDKLFQPFQRLHQQADFPGTGIGLATVQRVLRRHGGSAQASGSLGNGAVIWFSFVRPVVPEDTHG